MAFSVVTALAPTASRRSAPISAVAGIVTTQAITMLVATFQRTAETLRAAPTPMIEPVMVCVVETGMPR